MILTENINVLQASLIVEECFRNGIDTFFLSPGARCSPLTLAVARHPDVRAVLHFDERGLGFAALGYARATGRPGVVITTSGSAVSNLHPAVTEAFMDAQPMLLLTADRPPELRETGSNQTIDQVNHFGAQTVWHQDVPCPTTQISPAVILTTIDLALHHARGGPVHLNCMFREPLGPQPDRTDSEAHLLPVHAWHRGRQPYTTYREPALDLDELTAVELEDLLASPSSVVVVVGGGLTESEALAVLQLAAKRKWPVISDVCSGLHFGPHRGGVIRHIDALISPEGFPEDLHPEIVLQFGPRFLSKTLLQALAATPLTAWIHVSDRQGRFDPLHRLTHRFRLQIDRFCMKIERNGAQAADPEWRQRWLDRDREIDRIYSENLDKSDRITEPGVLRAVSRWMPNLHGLFLGASMPVRDMNRFAARNPHQIHVAANRGASGIDGTIASAAGFARGLNRPVTLAIGDLTALHDLNSLALLAAQRVPVILVILNNRGGGIFHFLPMADASPEFETYWGTPHKWSFEHAAAQFNLPYAKAKTMGEFSDTYRDALDSGVSCIIEVETDRRQNLLDHQALAKELPLSQNLR
ncbi:MAG: 2-succinyl-5-enolpyruvyl-6-hydroxy-3-cyclohexene-1-carboxylic-acid synthase [Verrucomicrobia bacterium]|nr:2-succinyl-5-enolpyruvyl-6-hydroxy-3-cyclohexene-1-carboxylic-acid synthase [Verrucomicrobiota bacterium]MCH8529062.1 2-succinyl-5-enolpyruvyl-6-hydroxy-3-cyclohexene-1-carboxylic-acid synthase [Kiritimatiellia bacterium]